MEKHLIHAEYLMEIKRDRQRSAAQLSCRCLDLLAECARSSKAPNKAALIEELLALAESLCLVRPSMATIRNLTDRWVEQFNATPQKTLEAARRHALTTALALQEASAHAGKAIAQHACELIGANKTIFTHSFSSTIVEVFYALRETHVRAIVTESRPLREGRQLAKRLSEMAIPTLYITDAQIGIFIGQADFVLVGADTILADGSIINKTGTYLLALAAHDQRVPFYVCCESFKFDFTKTEPGLPEEMPAEEIDPPPYPGLRPHNIYFDVTPAPLVAGWITEQGLQTRITRNAVHATH